MALFKKTKLEQIEAHAQPKQHRPLILLVDDEEANLRVMSAILSPFYQVSCAISGQQALELLENLENPIDLACIISDQRMPGMTGVELLQQSLHIVPEANRIIVTGFSDINAIIDSINKAEIYRYIVKPFDTNDFVLTIQRAVETFAMKRQLQSFHRDLEEKVKQRTAQLAEKNLELERANHALQEASLTDPLTGLRNRRFLLQQLDADVTIIIRQHDERIKARRPVETHDTDIAFFMVDVDYFKKVNDEHGHAAGDTVLVQMRERLREVFRESDYLTRWGGEEFLVVARATNRQDAGTVAERMRNAIARRPFILEDGTELHKTCSICFACLPFLPNHPHSLTWGQIVELADQALYMAKHSGRNAWVGLYCDAQADPVDLYGRLIQNITQAIERGMLYKVSSASVQSAATTTQTIGE